MLANLKYLYDENKLIKDYGKSMKFNKFYISYYDYTGEEETEEIILFNTEKELLNYLEKNGLKSRK